MIGKMIFFLCYWLLYMVAVLVCIFQYICDKNHEWTVVFGVTYETSLWQLGDPEEHNGTEEKKNILKQSMRYLPLGLKI